VFNRHPFLQAKRTCQWLADAIEAARKKHHFDLCFMPDHVHLVIRPRQKHYHISSILSGIKTPVARRAIQFLQEHDSSWLPRLTRQRGSRTERLFWQSGGGHDRNITCGKTLLKMLDSCTSILSVAVSWRWRAIGSGQARHGLKAVRHPCTSTRFLPNGGRAKKHSHPSEPPNGMHLASILCK